MGTLGGGEGEPNEVIWTMKIFLKFRSILLTVSSTIAGTHSFYHVTVTQYEGIDSRG
jgi:hypothetical protein